MDQSVAAVSRWKDEYGLNRCCRAIGLSKGTWHYRPNGYQGENPADERVLGVLKEAIDEYPEYGWRRLKPELEDRLGEPINHKRIKRLLRENVLGQERCLPKHTPSPIDRTLRENSSSVNLVRGREFGPMEALVTDFTQLAYDTDSNRVAFSKRRAELRPIAFRSCEEMSRALRGGTSRTSCSWISNFRNAAASRGSGR